MDHGADLRPGLQDPQMHVDFARRPTMTADSLSAQVDFDQVLRRDVTLDETRRGYQRAVYRHPDRNVPVLAGDQSAFRQPPAAVDDLAGNIAAHHRLNTVTPATRVRSTRPIN